MSVIIHYRGQLASAMGVDSEELDIAQASSIRSVLQEISARGGGAFAEIALDDYGAPRRTLLVAIDGEQITDFGLKIASHVKEITLIPPIAGG